jgi:hypothetical protein
MRIYQYDGWPALLFQRFRQLFDPANASQLFPVGEIPKLKRASPPGHMCADKLAEDGDVES